jgi:hypothetical protein
MAATTATAALDSGTKPVDNEGGDNGSIWDSIFSNAGSIFTGGAALVNAFKNNQPVTNVYQAPPSAGMTMGMGNIWIWIGLAVLVIILLFVMLKK